MNCNSKTPSFVFLCFLKFFLFSFFTIAMNKGLHFISVHFISVASNTPLRLAVSAADRCGKTFYHDAPAVSERNAAACASL